VVISQLVLYVLLVHTRTFKVPLAVISVLLVLPNLLSVNSIVLPVIQVSMHLSTVQSAVCHARVVRSLVNPVHTFVSLVKMALTQVRLPPPRVDGVVMAPLPMPIRLVVWVLLTVLLVCSTLKTRLTVVNTVLLVTLKLPMET